MKRCRDLNGWPRCIALWGVWCLLNALVAAEASALDANRFCYLDEPVNPYYVDGDFPKLTAAQWTGDPDIHAVVVLAIDDMRDTAKYEAYLRPILDRLKAFQERASLSIMTNRVDPNDKQLSQWIDEGVSMEVHTIDHPCPLLHDSDFQQAKRTYDDCVDLMNGIPGNRPVAFRMPCCDSLNTPSPRFYQAIFAQTTSAGNYLTIDSSVFVVLDRSDPDLARQQTVDEDGRPTFQKYLPFPSFVNTIRNYPYPYQIGHACWQFPCIVPSDWEAQNLHQPNNPRTVEDLKTALDLVVQKRGVLNLVFHPHGWMRNDQVVQLIDHAAQRHGKHVRFMSFREAEHRLRDALVDGAALRQDDGSDAGVRLADVNRDGYQDVLQLAPDGKLTTRIWNQATSTWITHHLTTGGGAFHLGIVPAADHAQAEEREKQRTEDSRVVLIVNGPCRWQQFAMQDGQWRAMPSTVFDRVQSVTQRSVAVRLRDTDNDNACELLVQTETGKVAVCHWRSDHWQFCGAELPQHIRIVRDDGKDAGLRWIDIDGDSLDECLFSDGRRYSVHRFDGTQWQPLLVGERYSGDAESQAELARDKKSSDDESSTQPAPRVVLPPFIRPDGSNNGVWAHSGHLWWQNEDTARLPDHVDRLAFATLQNVQRNQDAPDQSATFPGPTHPLDALSTFRSSVDAAVELVAAEPLVADPVAFDWGADGRLWITEMRDYPHSTSDAIRGRIRVLEDSDQDGRFDQSEVFLDGLEYPTGVKAWRNGVLVLSPPDLLFAEDTDGDRRADRTKVLFRGFTQGNQQHRANGMRWGFDNWLYIANGDSGGSVESTRTGERVAMSGRDLRVRPDTGEMQSVSGQTQFGRTPDDHGQWFGGNNSDPIWHYVLQDEYVRRNPHHAAATVRHSIPEFPGPAPVFPVSKTLPRFNDFDRANRFTSACSPLIVHSSAGAPHFGPPGTVDTYVCEPVHNLVNRQRRYPDGVTFGSKRLPEDRAAEFLASTDNWFRPVMLRIGPEGAIWVADMYRLVVEHPEWIPEKWQRRLDLRAGYDRGRIYRVWPRGQRRENARLPIMENWSTSQLVAQLCSALRARRDMAQQVLIWRNDRTAIPHLRRTAASGDGMSSVYAAHVLLAMDALDDETIVTALQRLDEGLPQTSRVLRCWVRLCESRLDSAERVRQRFLALCEQDRLAVARPTLQLQLACSLGVINSADASDALARVAMQNERSRWIRSAVLSSLTRENIKGVFRRLDQSLRDTTKTGISPARARLFSELAQQAIALGDAPLHNRVFNALTRPDGRDRQSAERWPWRATALAAVMDIQRQKDADDPTETQSPTGFDRQTQQQLNQAARHARRIVGDPQYSETTRQAYLSLLRADVGDPQANRELLASLLDPRVPHALQRRAASQLLHQFADQAASEILRAWSSYTPRTRRHLVSQMLRNAKQRHDLLKLAHERNIELRLDARQRQQLLDRTEDPRVRKLATSLFATSDSERTAVVHEYEKSVSRLNGDPQRGSQIFQRVCSTCHQLGSHGHAVGPDLAAVHRKSHAYLLAAILDPNRAVESTYYDYQVVTNRGEQFSGILRAETATSLTLLAPEAKTHVVLRRDIDQVHATGRSLMPEGLEKDLSPQQMADLLAFIRSSSQHAPKTVAGNTPQVVPKRDDGSMRLLAMHAEIYGPTLTFQPKHQNLSNWSSLGDHAVWTVQVDEQSTYDVRIEYACTDEAAGLPFSLSCGDDSLDATTIASGGRNEYRSHHLGRLTLPAGKSRVVLRSAGPLPSSVSLMNLHRLILYPR